MSKYAPLTRNLRSLNRSRIPMRFADIEKLLGFALPPSSHSHRAWWSNNPNNNVMTKAWLAAGYRTEDVDLASEKLVFVRDETATSSTPVAPGRHPAWGALKGTSRVASGVDLTAPADPDWGQVHGG